MKRKIISLVLTLSLLALLFIPTYASDGFVLTVEKDGTPVTSVSVGDSITVTIKSPKIIKDDMEGGIGIWLNFDKTKFEMTGTATSAIPGCVVNTDVTDAATANTNGWVKANSSNVTAGMSSGDVVVSATFIAKAEGNANFSVTVDEISNGSGVDKTSEYPAPADTIITVAAPTVAVTGISLNKTALALTEGNSETLTATVTPGNATDKTVTWSSSKEGVAMVDANGKVTAVAAGDAIITAKAGDKTATCTVTVSAAPCIHPNKMEVAEKASTCAEKGWDAYKKCNDCGKLFDASGNEISEIPYRALSTTHTEGTPATCTAKAVCSVCHQSYGDYAAHQYTKQVKNADTLKIAGTCKDKAVYWYSCEVCSKVEKNDSRTFEGDKDANNHVGETTLVNVKAPVHNTQTPGYTGDTKCLDCNTIIASGTSIPADQHVAGDKWTFDGESHWKTCKVEGCDAIIESTKSSHTPSAWVNIGDGYHHQTCTVCEKELTHEACIFGQTLKYNANSHWEECTKCGDKKNEATHEFLPDSDKCTVCGYTKSSNITIITPTQPGDSKPADGNPSTGAVSSPVGYVVIGLAAVGALCFGAKKLTKKHED